MQISPREGTMSDRYVLTVQLSVAGIGGYQRYFPPTFPDFSLVDSSTQQSTQWMQDPQRGQEIRTVEHRVYRLTPRRAGVLTIGAARLRVEGKEYETRPVSVRVAGGAVAVAPPGGSPAPPGAGPTVAGGALGSAAPGPGPAAAASASTPLVAPGAAAGGAPPAAGASPSGSSPAAGAATGAPTIGEEDVVVVAAVDRPKVYVGEQVTVTWTLMTRWDVLRYRTVTDPRADAFWTEDVFAANRLSYTRQVVNGREYAVATLIKKALFPLRAGRLDIGKMEAEITTLESGFFASAPLLRKSNMVSVEVAPLPPEGRPALFVPSNVGHYTIVAEVDRTRAAAGEPIVLKLSARGKGNVRGVTLPKLTALDGFKIHAPRVADQLEPGEVVAGAKTAQYLLLPERGGTLTIPAIELAYFDPGERRYEVVRTEPIDVTVVGDPRTAKAGTPGVSLLRGDNVLARSIRPVKRLSHLRSRVGATLYRTRLIWLFAVLPPALYVLLVATDRVRERLRRVTPRARLRRARGRARRRMRTAELHLRANQAGPFFGEIARVLVEHLEDRIEETISGLTRDDLRGKLVARGFPEETVEALVRELENCDFARFAPSASGPGEMRAASRRARALLGAIERVQPRPSSPLVVAVRREAGSRDGVSREVSP
jgi:uncharacterized protein with GYD domain